MNVRSISKVLRSMVHEDGVDIRLVVVFFAVLGWLVITVGGVVALVVGQLAAGGFLLVLSVLMILGIAISLTVISNREQRLLASLGEHQHVWEKWCSPYGVEMVRFDRATGRERFRYREYHQRRSCTTCGEVEERVVADDDS